MVGLYTCEFYIHLAEKCDCIGTVISTSLLSIFLTVFLALSAVIIIIVPVRAKFKAQNNVTVELESTDKISRSETRMKSIITTDNVAYGQTLFNN